MKTKGTTDKNPKTSKLQQQTKEEKIAHQSRIALDKTMARQWVEQRKLRANPVQSVQDLQLVSRQPGKLNIPPLRRKLQLIIVLPLFGT